MTWTISLSGHEDGEQWSAEGEKQIAELVRPLLEDLRARGLHLAGFTGNHYAEDLMTGKVYRDDTEDEEND